MLAEVGVCVAAVVVFGSDFCVFGSDCGGLASTDGVLVFTAY